MRISDWSSDVCSSDLLALPVEQPLERRGGKEQRHRDFTPEQGREHVNRLDTREHARDEVAGIERRAIAAARHLVVGGAVDIVELGRATCRERVFKYV